MSIEPTPRRPWLPALAAAVLAAVLPIAAGPDADPAPEPALDPAEAVLRELRPDYRIYVGAVRPMSDAASDGASVYMALVRPGAGDPGRRDCAPFAGSGVRNDILYDAEVLDGSRGRAWTMLLLDHEYFHARHLAGATALPLPLRTGAGIERHFFEAAAWGHTVSEARAGRYPGLGEAEFREALDRFGEHYRALRALVRDESPALWSSLDDPLREVAAVRVAASPPPAAPAHLSDPGRAPAIP